MKKKYSVLVVDDAFFIRNLIKRAIGNKPSSDYPYEFEIAGEGLNGEEGLLLYKALKPDIVTVDVNMGSLGGVAFIKKLRAFDKEAQVIVISSSLDNNLKAEISKLGCYYIQKPFQEAYLWRKLDTIAEYLMSKPKKIVQPKKAEQSNPVVNEAQKKDLVDNKVSKPVVKKETAKKDTANIKVNTEVKTDVKTEDKKEVNKNKSNKQQNKPQNNNQKKNQSNKNKQKKKHLLDDDDSLVGTIPEEVLKGYKNKPSQQLNNKANKPSQNKANKQSKQKNQNNKHKTKEVNRPIDDFVVEEGLNINAMRNRIKQNTAKNEVKKPIEEPKKTVIKTPPIEVVEVIEEVVVPVKKEPIIEAPKKETIEPIKIEPIKEEVIEIPTINEEVQVKEDVLEITFEDEVLDISNDEDNSLVIEDESDLVIIDEPSIDTEKTLVEDFIKEDNELTINDDNELIIEDEVLNIVEDEEITIEDEELEIIDDEVLDIVDEEEITIEDEPLDIIDDDDDGELILSYDEDIPLSLDVQENILEGELEEDLMLTENVPYEGHYEDEDLEIVEDEEIELVEEPSIEDVEELSIEDRLLEDISYNMDELLTKSVDDKEVSKEELQISILNEIAKDLKVEFDKAVEEKKQLSVEEELGIENEDETIAFDDDDFDFDDFKDIEFNLDTGSYAEDLPIKNENMYYQTDNAPKKELNIYNDNYNTVNNEIKHTSSGGVKIAPPKDSRLREIYSAKMEKDYNIVFDENKVDEPAEPVKKDSLFSKLFNKKKKKK